MSDRVGQREWNLSSTLYCIPPIFAHFSLAWSVCLSSVCHIHPTCLNRPTDLDAIWQIRLLGPMTRDGVRCGSLAPRGRVHLGKNPKRAITSDLRKKVFYDSRGGSSIASAIPRFTE